MLETQTRYTYQKPTSTPPPQCVKSVFAKVATGGTIEKPVFEMVKIIEQASGEWWKVRSANGQEWYCLRSEMRRLFPVLGV